jgi:hypothetical protein
LTLSATGAHGAGSDPHAKKPAAEAPAPKKAEGHAPKVDAHAKADAHAAQPGAHPAAANSHAAEKPLATNLHELSDRIQDRLVEVVRAQQAAAKTGGAAAAKPGSAASKARPHARSDDAAKPRAPRVEQRIEVVWTISVAWPEELQPRDSAAQSGERVSLSWETPAETRSGGSFGVAP